MERYDIVLENDAYIIDKKNGFLKIDKQIFNDFIQNSVIKILFLTENENIFEYKMVSEDNNYIYLEYFGD